jgi:hypothetical protein
MSSTSACILEGFVKEDEWAPANKVSKRTSKRYRDDGLPYMEWAGFIWIHQQGAREYLSARIRRRRNPARQREKAARGNAAA